VVEMRWDESNAKSRAGETINPSSVVHRNRSPSASEPSQNHKSARRQDCETGLGVADGPDYSRR
jgi:hypothetical protein